MIDKIRNSTTKLNWILFTKVIRTKQGRLDLDRESNEEKHKHFNLERVDLESNQEWKSPSSLIWRE